MFAAGRFWVVALAWGVAACTSSPTLGTGVDVVHSDVLTLDSHVDIPFDFMTPAADPGTRGVSQVDLPKMREGGLDAAFFIVYVPQTRRDRHGYDLARRQALGKFEAIHQMAEEVYKDEIELAYSASDVGRIHGQGKLVALIGVENGFAIGQDLRLIEDFFRRGARYMSLTHNGHTDLADSAIVRFDLGDRPEEHGGISALGLEAVAEMNRLGIMVDVAHASRKTVLDAARVSQAPIISSHHALRAFVDIPRNLTDAEVIAIAGTGGVVQIVAFDSYVRAMDPERQKARQGLAMSYGIRTPLDYYGLSTEKRRAYLQARRDLDKAFDRGSLQDLVDEIDYAVNLVGIDHVGIASDFDGGGGVVGWDDASETGNVTAELYRRGYSKGEIEKLWSGNLLRVMAETEAVAARLREPALAGATP